MSIEDPSVGPLQIVIVGFETTERFRGRSRASCSISGAAE
jgi:hypothetical protein